MGASASPTDRTGWAVIAPKVQPSRQRKTRRKTLWKRRTVEKSEERLFPRAWKSRQVRGIPTFPQRPRRLDDEESQKPKPDISLATKSGHFNLLRTAENFHKIFAMPSSEETDIRLGFLTPSDLDDLVGFIILI